MQQENPNKEKTKQQLKEKEDSEMMQQNMPKEVLK